MYMKAYCELKAIREREREAIREREREIDKGDLTKG